MPDPMPIVHRVLGRLEPGDQSVSSIVEACELELMDSGFQEAARAYISFRVRQDISRAARLKPDRLAIANYIHAAKYARWVNGRREVFDETVDRVMDMHIRRYPHLVKEIEWAFGFVRRKEIMPSMRSMQFGGVAIEKNHARMYNCSFTHIDRWRAFQEAFFLLLSGCGVGYSVQWHHVDQLTPLGYVNERDVVHHVVQDTIEGWADALGALIDGIRAGVWVEFSYHLVRREGSPLVTSGGKAPGHIPLRDMLERVRGVLMGAQGRSLRPIECHDVLCHVAEAVLAGGIRRSSLIALFSPSDTEMLYCKAKGNFYPGGLNAQREMANNSAVLLREGDRADYDRVMKVSAENFGDPGFYFTSDLEEGANPCGEITLRPWIWQCNAHGWLKQRCCPLGRRRTGFQFCNLVECNGPGLEKARAAALIGTLQAGYADFPYLGEVTEQITRGEALLGVGVTAIQDHPIDLDLYRECAQEVLRVNERIAGAIGIQVAARCTTVKPSGTASLALGGVAPGIHPQHARRFFQRVTANPLEPAAQYFRACNPHMVEEKPNGDWSIVFPVEADGVTVKEQSGVDFCQLVMGIYDAWIKPGGRDGCHNVSCTVTVREGEDVTSWIWEHRYSLRAMASAPFFLDKAFHFAPKRECYPEDESRWNELIRLYKPVDWSAFQEEEDGTTRRMTVACSGGSCG